MGSRIDRVSRLFRECKNYAYFCTKTFSCSYGLTESAVSMEKHETLGFGDISAYPKRCAVKFSKSYTHPTPPTIVVPDCVPDVKNISTYGKVLKFSRGINTHGKLKGTYVRFLEACLSPLKDKALTRAGQSRKTLAKLKLRKTSAKLKPQTCGKVIAFNSRRAAGVGLPKGAKIIHKLRTRHMLLFATQKALRGYVQVRGDTFLPIRCIFRGFLMSLENNYRSTRSGVRVSLQYLAYTMFGSVPHQHKSKVRKQSRIYQVPCARIRQLASIKIFRTRGDLSVKCHLFYLLRNPPHHLSTHSLTNVIRFVKSKRWSRLNLASGKLGFRTHSQNPVGLIGVRGPGTGLWGGHLRRLHSCLLKRGPISRGHREQLWRAAKGSVYRFCIKSVTGWAKIKPKQKLLTLLESRLLMARKYYRGVTKRPRII